MLGASELGVAAVLLTLALVRVLERWFENFCRAGYLQL